MWAVPTTAIAVTALAASTLYMILTQPSAAPDAVAHLHAVLDPQSKSLQELLTARAHANTRLAYFLGITNTFVSASEVEHATFRKSARALLSRFSMRLSTFPHTSRTLLTDLATNLPFPLPFDTFIQLTVFVLIINAFLDAEIPPDAWKDILSVTQGINDLWALSKTSAIPSPSAHAQLANMHAHLRRWLPEEHQAAPLDFVIPIYETTWRVVAAVIAHADAADTEALRALTAAPTNTERWRRVEGLVNETLRLHPPVKRIARVTMPSTGWHALVPEWLRPLFRTKLVADIRASHTDPTVWGADADIFDPTRIAGDAQQHSLAPFGKGPLSCVAVRDAPRAVALVAGAILELVKGVRESRTSELRAHLLS